MKRRARRCLGVDIGSTSIKVAELSQDRTGVLIQRLVEAPLEITPETPADERWAAVVRTLRDVLRENKISARQAAFALPGHAVFVRRVRLPRTTEERLHRIIRFEARQQIPFPLEQTLLQFQISSTDVPDEVEVLLVAIKRDIVDNFMQLIRRLGLRAVQLGVSSFALFNFHMFDAAIEPEEFSLDLTSVAKVEPVPTATPTPAPAKPSSGLGARLRGLLKSKPKAAPAATPAPAETASREIVPVAAEEIKAFVNIGAGTMDLAIGRPGGHIIGFARSIPVAGHQLTRIIQERCGAESFAQAERIKREHTAIGTPPSTGFNEQASRVIMPVIDRMVAEIRRSLDFYISQPDGVAVDRLVLSGGQARLPGLAAYMGERLGIPVEISGEIRNPSCRSNVRGDVDLSHHLVAIGLAIQGLGEGCITVDFLPEHLKGWIEFKRKNVQLAIQAAILAGMLVISSQVGNRMGGLWNDRATQINLDIIDRQALQKRLEEAIQRQGRAVIALLLTERASVVGEEYGLDRDYVFKILTLIQAARPADVFFDSVEMGANGELRIEGLADQQSSPARMVEFLKSVKDIANATLAGLPIEQRDRAGGRAMWRFQLLAQVKGKLSKVVPSPTPAGWRPGAPWGPTRLPAGPTTSPRSADIES